MRGRLITLEGIDGSGKTSVWRLLRSRVDAVFTREPTGMWTGDAVRRAIASDVDPIAELFLFMADHALHLNAIVGPGLDAGRTVISDRYSDSRCAYQGVTLRERIGDPVEWVRELHEGWSIRPDLTILFKVDPHLAVERVGDRGDKTKFERIEFLGEVQSLYQSFAEEEPDRFRVVDAGRPLDQVLEEVVELIG